MGLGRTFCGSRIKRSQIELIREVVGNYQALSRTELAHTMCELLRWKRASGRLKWRECLDLLEQLERESVIALPDKQPRRPLGSRTHVPVTGEGDPREGLAGDLAGASAAAGLVLAHRGRRGVARAHAPARGDARFPRERSAGGARRPGSVLASRPQRPCPSRRRDASRPGRSERAT